MEGEPKLSLNMLERVEEVQIDENKEKEKKQLFGVIVIGPSGSGKTTLCDGLQQFFSAVDRSSCLINLDPANEKPNYKADVNIEDLITLDDVMENLKLGPNGGLIYCMEFLESNFEWLRDKIQEKERLYHVIDFPGQLELFLNTESVKKILKNLKEELNMRITVVELFDSHYIYDSSKFLSACCYSLMSMVNLNFPHINVLSKIDLIKEIKDLPFKIDFYLECHDFQRIGEDIKNKDGKFGEKWEGLTNNLCQLLNNYGMSSFFPLDVMDQVNVSNLVAKIDKCNGFSITGNKEKNSDVRDEVYRDESLSNFKTTLTKFEKQVEDQEEDLMVKQLKLFEMLAKGEITEDEMYAQMN